MPFIKTELEGLFIFEPQVFEDERGFFFESYNERLFQQHHLSVVFIQDNQSFSHYGVIRGLHFQREPHGQSKLIRVLLGTILDVVVDIRRDSPTFGRSLSIELSSENKKQLFIPKGFAHGFSVLSPTADVMYKCDAFYHKESENGIVYNDPSLGIDWQVPQENQIISPKDLKLPGFAECMKNI
jgi:dTDP-4-dehydrorhamnose 3,5-epimerase